MADRGVVAGTPEELIQSRAIECGGAAVGNGSNLLVDAEAKGEENSRARTGSEPGAMDGGSARWVAAHEDASGVTCL
jgi:hypothetical protein